jgi:ribosomal protein L22
MAEKTKTKSKDVPVAENTKEKAVKTLTRVQSKRESMQISLKHTHEIMEAVKGKDVTKAVNFLKKVLLKEAYIPFRKFPSKGHKHGVPAGFPKKATKQVISILEEMKSNAKNMGFDESKIVVSGYALGRGGYPRFSSGSIYRHGKRTNLTVYSFVNQERKIVQKKVEKVEAKGEKPTDTAVSVENEKKDTKHENSTVEETVQDNKKQENNKSNENNELKAEK